MVSLSGERTASVRDGRGRSVKLVRAARTMRTMMVSRSRVAPREMGLNDLGAILQMLL